MLCIAQPGQETCSPCIVPMMAPFMFEARLLKGAVPGAALEDNLETRCKM